MKKGTNYSCIQFQEEIDCSIIQVNFSNDVVKIFVAVYGAKTFRLMKLFPKINFLLQFLKSLRGDTIIFGNFNIETLRELNDKAEYTLLIAAYDLDVRKFSPTIITPTSKTYLNHFMTKRSISTKIRTSITDRFKITANIRANQKESKNMKIPLVCNLSRIKADSKPNSIFLLDQKLIEFTEISNVNEQMNTISNL